MKRIVTFLLVLVSLVGIIGYSPVSAKTWDKSTTRKYRIKILDEGVCANPVCYTDVLGKYDVFASLESNASLQLVLVNKKGKRIKSNVEFQISEGTKETKKLFTVTKKGKVTYKGVVDPTQFTYTITITAKYKGKLVKNVFAYISGIGKHYGSYTPVKKNPWEDYEEAWNEEYHLVPDDYVWCANTLDWYQALVGYHTIRTSESVMLVKGTKQKWVLKSCITGDTISLDKCEFYVEEYDEGALVKGKKATTTAKYFNGLWATPEARIYVIYGDKYYWCDVYIYDTAEDAWEAETTMP